MATVYGENYQKEWIDDPARQAEKGSRNARTINQYEEASGIVSGDEVVLCKIQYRARFLGVESLVGALGAGGVAAVDKDGNSTALAAGDLLDGHIDGGLDIVLTADGATAAAIKVLVKFLMD